MNRVSFYFGLLFGEFASLIVLAVDAPPDKAADEFRGKTAETPPVIDYLKYVQPIFVSKCYSCHGPNEHKSGLRLDRRTNALLGGDSGPVILPGKSSESLLIRYVTGMNEDNIIMPLKGERLSEAQIACLKAWIDQGAPWPEAPDPKPLNQIKHWAFNLPQRHTIPKVTRTGWVRNAIDAFVLARLEKEQISPAPEADRSILIRRLSLDLLGLPPAPREVERFVQDLNPAAYEDLVNRYLASPHFGERWSRHWLDQARYADSDGYEDDKFRPDAWRFRDWVIDAYNRDLPFDQFTLLQLAGDLMPDATYDQRLATGFQRMTLSNNAGAGGIKEEYRVKTVKDRLNTSGTVWLGLTVGCAECHSHKYDPISQREYYQLFAFFNNADEAAIPAPRLSERYFREYQEATRGFEERIRQVRKDLERYEKTILPSNQEKWERTVLDSSQLPETIRTILARPANRRSSNERAELAKYYRSLDSEYGRLKSALPMGDEVGNNQPQPPSERAMVLSENQTDPRKSYLQKKGDFLKSGVEVDPRSPAFLPPLASRAGKPDRLDLARWIVDPKNPLTSRVAVNHIWQILFGQGLVATPDNFGLKGERPSHPDLLDWLATEFIARGWSRKEIVRLIVDSSTYRQSSQYRPELEEKDPNNTLLSRQNRLRVETECVRDMALAAAGLLNEEIGGPSFQPPLPVALSKAKELKNERFMEPSTSAHRYRRGVYIMVQRTFLFPMLKAFDVADANVSCLRRERSNTPLQALTLLNDPVFFEAAQALGLRVLRECPTDQTHRIRYLYDLCLSRPPAAEEMAAIQHSYLELLDFHRQDSQAAAEFIGPRTVPEGIALSEAAAWIGLARAVMNFDEFIARE